jgi:hypothetical protein
MPDHQSLGLSDFDAWCHILHGKIGIQLKLELTLSFQNGRSALRTLPVIGWLLPPLSTGSRLAGCPVSFFIRFL